MSQPTPPTQRLNKVAILAMGIVVAIQEFAKVHPDTSAQDALSAVATVHANLLKDFLGPEQVAQALRDLADRTEQAFHNMPTQAPSTTTMQ